MINDLFVPDPPSGDSSNRIPTTRFVQTTANSAASAAVTSALNVAGLSVLGNASTGTATAAAITGAANQLLAVNAAATTVLFESVSSYIDNAIGSAQGAILYRNSGSWVSLAPGTQSTFLQAQGAAANPQWAAPGLTLLNTLSPSNVATTGDTTSLTSSYRNYLITFENICPATQSTTLLMQVATAGTAFIAAGYNIGRGGIETAAVTGVFLSGANQCATSTNVGVNGWVVFFNPSRSGTFKVVSGALSFLDSSNNTGIAMLDWAGYQATATAAVTGVQFLFSAGNIQTGTIRIYGMA